MNLNQGKRNKQAVQVLNKVEYDSEGNPIGMMEDPSNPASANFGTPREPRRGGCYKGDGSAYITITGLLSTDTVEVFDGSDMPTISDDRLDIASGNRIFGVRILRAGELWAKYNCSENSGDICYDSSGNGNHGQIVNVITTTPEENPNSIHQYQDVYSFENEEGYSESGSVLIPKNSSITIPPFKDVLGNNLQYIGKVPGKAKFVGSNCFLSDGNAYLSGDVLTADTITAHPESEVPVCTTDGRLDFPNVNGKYYDITIERGGSVIARLPFCEPIIDPSNHTYHDVSGNGNHATLINGTLANEGKQDKFHYLQKGFSNYTPVRTATNISGGTTWNVRNSLTIGGSGYIVEWLYRGGTGGNQNTTRLFIPGGYFSIRTGFTDIYVGAFARVYFPPGYVRDKVRKIFVVYDGSILKCTTSDGYTLFSLSRVIELNTSYSIGLQLNFDVDNVDRSYYFKLSDLNGNIRLLAPTSKEYKLPNEPNFMWRFDGINMIPEDVSVTQLYFDEDIVAKFPKIGSSTDIVGNSLSVPQDSHSFLNTGTELEAYDYPALKQADKDNNFWYIGDAGVRRVSHYELAIENLMSDKIFLDRTDKNI